MNDYIDTGLADDLVDPDKGANVERKMQSVAAETSSSRSGTAETIPPKPAADSPGWTGFLTNLPPVSYGQSIWNHFAERPIVEAVDGVRISPDHDVVPSGQSEPKTAAEQSEAVASTAAAAAAEGSEEATDESEVLSSFRGLCKGYKFFANKHVQAIEMHDLDGHPGFCYVRAKVLPSMRKTEPYKVWVCLRRNAAVAAAGCVCTAGLAGSCNHVAGLLYALEDFVVEGLREEDPRSPTSRLCRWNIPRSRKVRPLPIADVRLERARHGGPKRARGNKPCYIPLPPNHRVVNPEHGRRLRRELQQAHEHALSKETTGHVEKYGSTTFLTAMETSSESEESDSESNSDEEPEPSQRSSLSTSASQIPSTNAKSADEFYAQEVVVSVQQRLAIELSTRDQAQCQAWFVERRKRITAAHAKTLSSPAARKGKQDLCKTSWQEDFKAIERRSGETTTRMLPWPNMRQSSRQRSQTLPSRAVVW